MNLCEVPDCINAWSSFGLCTKHYQRWRKYGTTDAPPKRVYKRIPEEQRFWDLVDRDDLGGCWQWLGSLDRGYGKFSPDYRSKSTLRPHRYSYELVHGPIPDGLTIDHLCRNRACVNPDHLEAVTNQVNILRSKGPSALNAAKTHCKNGHPYDPHSTGRRTCETCERETVVARAARQTAAELQQALGVLLKLKSNTVLTEALAPGWLDGAIESVRIEIQETT